MGKPKIPDEFRNKNVLSIDDLNDVFQISREELAMLISRLTELGHRYGGMELGEILRLLPRSHNNPRW